MQTHHDAILIVFELGQQILDVAPCFPVRDLGILAECFERKAQVCFIYLACSFSTVCVAYSQPVTGAQAVGEKPNGDPLRHLMVFTRNRLERVRDAPLLKFRNAAGLGLFFPIDKRETT